MVWVRVRSQVGSGWPIKNTGRVTGQPIFALGQKIGFGSGIFRVGSGWVRKFWPVLPCLLTTHKSKLWHLLVRATAAKRTEKPQQSNTNKLLPTTFYFRFPKMHTSFHKTYPTGILNRLRSKKPRKINLNGAKMCSHA